MSLGLDDAMVSVPPRSQHEDIDLVSEEEFYASAPAAISRPGETEEDEHQRMLCRLEWELEQRKQYGHFILVN